MKPKAQNKVPKRAISRPKTGSLKGLIVIVLIWVPHTLPLLMNMAALQLIFMMVLAPLAIVGLFLSYNAGLSAAKQNYEQVSKGELSKTYWKLIAIQLLCVVGCLVIEEMLTGYPYKMCFDTCLRVKLFDAIIAYLKVTTVMFIPAYYSIYRYKRWVKKYNLGNPVK